MPDALPFKQVLEVILIVAASLGGLGVLVVLLMRGVWAKMGEPVVKELFKAWQASPEQIAAQETFVKKVIENEIRRDDGLIHKEIKSKTDAMGEKLLEAFADLEKKLDERLQQGGEFQQNVIQRLSTIEGGMKFLMGGKRVPGAESDAGFKPPAFEPRKPSR